jgi:hypothetical protein
MKTPARPYLACLAALASLSLSTHAAENTPGLRASISLTRDGEARSYLLRTEAPLRGNSPADHQASISEKSNQPSLRSGNLLFDGLYALAVQEALQNSVSEIKDFAYNNNQPFRLEAFQTGELWTYVWTRDLCYAVDLGLGGFDARRAVSSLLFKSSDTKAWAPGGFRHQAIQDTGSGGSWPVSSDRVVWALGADAALRALPEAERDEFLGKAYQILHDTVEQDRRVIWDPADGLYRGEQSFLDWREQTYPAWTADQVLPIALSKALSTNVLAYIALDRTSAYATMLGRSAEGKRYAAMAAELKQAINRHFYDEEAGLYAAFLLSDGGPAVRVHRYDLLGESLAILSGIADPARSASILRHYPVGPHGPSVVWPQDKGVPIYHNQAIWPFVTAYWLKAACKAGNAEAIERGVLWMQKSTAENLSNMENYDWVSGRAEVKEAELKGPVVNSRRQLWSVGAYLSTVQDVIFGLERSWAGLRFNPHLSAGLCRKLFSGQKSIELRNFGHLGTHNLVRIQLPELPASAEGLCLVAGIELNGRPVGPGPVALSELKPSNEWVIRLAPPAQAASSETLRQVDPAVASNFQGPSPAAWDKATGGLTLKDGRPTLHFTHSNADAVCFNIYRDGLLVAARHRGLEWTDNAPNDRRAHRYAIEAVDAVSGNAGQLTQSLAWNAGLPSLRLPASGMQVQGGRTEGTNVADWGLPSDTLEVPRFTVAATGRHELRIEFANGSGPVNTGIACCVKRLQLFNATTGAKLLTTYVVMPQSGDAKRWDLSSPVLADLEAGIEYHLLLDEDVVSRNMSYLSQNARYTSWPGGGETAHNRVSIASIQVQNLGPN